MTNKSYPSPDDPKNLEPWYYRYQLMFRSYDQAAVAFVLALSIAGMIFYFTHRAYLENGLIDIDRIGHQKTQYLVDINTAEWPEIANLPGIGPKLARAIVDYREQIGRFSDHQSLIKVSGIGPAKFDRLKDFLAPIESDANE